MCVTADKNYVFYKSVMNTSTSNFAYNMQYIEYLEKQLSELTLSDVLLTILYKSYIITAMGIVEVLFVNLLKKNKKMGIQL